MNDCVNSVAMTVLMVNEGWRGPVVMADTGCEWPETDAYVERFDREWLQPRGLYVEHVGAKWRSERIARLHSVEGYALHYGMIPLAYARWCTQYFKTDPIKVYAIFQNGSHKSLGLCARSHRPASRYCR